MSKIAEITYLAFTIIYDALKTLHPSAPTSKEFEFSHNLLQSENTPKNTICIYAATMGEFQVARALIDHLNQLKKYELLIFVGQAQYIQVAKKTYPQAKVLNLPDLTHGEINKLFATHRPNACFLAEGPSAFKLFPINFGLALPMACIRQEIPVFIINACIYKLNIEGRLAWLQKKLLQSIFYKPIKVWYTPSETFRDDLLAASIPGDKIAVVGNLKFDFLCESIMAPPEGELVKVIKQIKSQWSHCIVGGSVNAVDEQQALIDGWLYLRTQQPRAGLVIAPRYVNNQEVIITLTNYLDKLNVNYIRRSEYASSNTIFDVLIVDVFGELMHYYEVADITYIGRNHGVLEPLRFSKPVIVAPRRDWAADYATFSLYKQMCDDKAIFELSDKSDIGKTFLDFIIDANHLRADYVSRSLQKINENHGAAKRIIEDICSRKLAEL